MNEVVNILKEIALESGIYKLFIGDGWKNAVMLGVGIILLYLAIFRDFEPYLLIPIGFGILIANFPGDTDIFIKTVIDETTGEAKYSGLLGFLYTGVKTGIYPCLIFLGIGATTDFGPLIANPKSMLLGAAAQLGIFITFLVAIALPQFDAKEAASIGIIGGADGPTAILVTTKLAPHLLASISVAAYSYMALVPVIQPPIIRLLTTKKERLIKMKQLREVSKLEKYYSQFSLQSL